MATKKAEVKLPSIPKGWVYVEFSKVENRGTPQERHVLSSATKDGAFEVEGAIYVAIPTTDEAMAAAVNGYSTKLDTLDGPITVSGLAALAVRQYKSGYEFVRNQLAAKAGEGVEITHDLAQVEFAAARPFSGRQSTTVVVTEEETKDMTKEQILDLLRVRGRLG